MAAEDGLGRAVEIRAYPPAVQSELPIWLTSAGGVDTFRAAARMRAGVLTHLLGQSLEEVAGKIAEYRRVAAAEHDGWTGHVVLMLHTLLGDDLERVRELVRGPFTAYLKSSANLTAKSFLGKDVDLAQLNAADMDYLAARAFDRYFDTGGLFGSVERAAELLPHNRALGVDEIGCLVDFGVESRAVLDGIDKLGKLHEIAAR
jgi:natural product biosynthesis luciferase-like monooxygenase protein